ncbi:hypothetical protein SUGI_0295890 [Cryptomeria japonica]|nr:hypothetical protein SUGI_0295890 [Cryptomeria japonica]
MLVEENLEGLLHIHTTPNANCDISDIHRMRDTVVPSSDKSDSTMKSPVFWVRRNADITRHAAMAVPDCRKTGGHCVMNSFEEEQPLVQPGLSDQYHGTVRSGHQFVGEAEGKNDSQGNAKNNLIDASNSSGIQDFEWENKNSKALHSPQGKW